MRHAVIHMWISQKYKTFTKACHSTCEVAALGVQVGDS